MKAKVNNHIVKIKIVDNNYNNYAKEVVIMEGIHKGRYAIVEDKDIVVDTYKQLTELCKLDIGQAENIEEAHITELISQTTYDIIKEFSQKYTLTNSEYYKLLDNYRYETCNNINEAKLMILINSLQKSINNIKSSFTSVKNRSLKEI